MYLKCEKYILLIAFQHRPALLYLPQDMFQYISFQMKQVGGLKATNTKEECIP